MTKQLRIIDFFCGAGGFSEGFRQQEVKIIMGIDNWRPAVETHNLNHDLNDFPIDILDFEHDWEAIDKRIPDAEIIIGSPPCVDFSMSNRAGKAHKGLGIRLIETYLRIVVVKKLKKGSILKAWLMENVPNSRNFVQETYSLKNLNLLDWAKAEGIKTTPDEIVIRVKNNGDIFNAADYGSPQGRKRFICGELVKTGEFPTPKLTYNKDGSRGLKRYVWLSDIKRMMPSPIAESSQKMWIDPNYPSLEIKTSELTDHFYDTGAYRVEWEKAKFQKTNHPYMGRMQFPEGEERTSRTIMATRSASTREALIYKSEYNRKGDGEYRLPTIREAASLMGFPYSYQFTGSEGTKWRQIGNAVCPHMASALAREIRIELGLSQINEVSFDELKDNSQKIKNLNNPVPKIFDKPPRKKAGAKFRIHPFKSGNMTVALVNYAPKEKAFSKTNGKAWYCVTFFGSGKKFDIVIITSSIRQKIENILLERMENDARKFFIDFSQEFENKVGDFSELQNILETNQPHINGILSPMSLVVEIGDFIEKFDDDNELFEDIKIMEFPKETIPKRQFLTMWAISKIISESSPLCLTDFNVTC